MNWTPFELLYEDEHLLAINKPCHILVHPTKISEDTVSVLELLEEQLNAKLYPIHRLDRATSGVLIFGKSSSVAGQLSAQFREQLVDKTYLAILRGFIESTGIIDYAIGDHDDRNKPKKSAITHYGLLKQSELPIAIGRYPSSRFSLVEAKPKTGRRHQIRRHFSHLRHPIIGDKRHGDVKHNKYFAEVWAINRLLLHAIQLEFQHPIKEERINVHAPLGRLFLKALDYLQLDLEEK